MRRRCADPVGYSGRALAGSRVYVHCRAGIGRTGLVIGCFLAEEEQDGKAALKRLNRLWRQSARAESWPKVPQTREQADYIRRWPKLRIQDRLRATQTDNSPAHDAALPVPQGALTVAPLDPGGGPAAAVGHRADLQRGLEHCPAGDPTRAIARRAVWRPLRNHRGRRQQPGSNLGIGAKARSERPRLRVMRRERSAACRQPSFAAGRPPAARCCA